MSRRMEASGKSAPRLACWQGRRERRKAGANRARMPGCLKIATPPMGGFPCRPAFVRAWRRMATGSTCTSSKPASKSRAGPAPCCCTGSPNSPIAGGASCRRSPKRGSMSSRRTSAASGGRPAGTRPMTRDLASFRLFNLVRDVLGLLDALGHREVALLAGHDYGASVAAWAALIRPDIFRRLALMSAPFPGPPDISPQPPPAGSIHDRSGGPRPAPQALSPVLLDAAGECRHAGLRRKGVHDFPAGPISTTRAPTGPGTGPSGWGGGPPGSWPGCRPTTSWTSAGRWRRRWRRRCPARRKSPPANGCRMPNSRSMRGNMSAPASREGCNGTAAERADGSTGSTNSSPGAVSRFPACFVSGTADWGVYQSPGALEAMEDRAA